MKKAVCVLMGIQALVLFAVVTPVFAQGNYPDRPVKILVGFTPGGGQDIVARIVAKKLTEALGQSVIVENRPGATGRIAAEAAAKAAPDGYTLFLLTNNDANNVAIYPKLEFDLIRDFVHVSKTSASPYLVTVHPSLPVKTVKELITYAKANPGKLNYGSSGTGSGAHLSTELFKSMTGIDIVHVPYKGGSEQLSDFFSGQLQVVFNTPLTLMPHAKSGRIRAIAVTSLKRIALMPEIPTVVESGVPGYEAGAWNGIAVPAGTPAPIVARLNREILKLLKAPDALELFNAQASNPGGSTPEEFTSFIKAETAKWTKVVKAIGLVVDK